ncbi:helix-turn-helix domain-containing protein [Streptomyces spirodelae]|uniref:Helix-turn-helix transcriptional regulator n=1 Tax=Streptomyces spirodelae TaxID=2812904 RepID=A0ABS3X1E0_9ACTN|nr:helix-turn-helix transcriptional regulator [Streptomyces spirodelae]MBO8189194.1 helix-turn-helix transcriptional regulator [Streptomyces spirodelae]
MGRPEKPVSTPNRSLARLAEWLRSARKDAGLTYAEMAERTVVARWTLQRATTGERIPRLPVVEAYARACGASVSMAQRLWRAARFEERRRTGQSRISEVPAPELVREPADLVAALQHLYYKSGALPFAEMERRAGGHGRLPHSAVFRMVKGLGMLQQDQLIPYLQVCGVPESEHARWMGAWTRAWRVRQLQRERWGETTYKKVAVAQPLYYVGPEGELRYRKPFAHYTPDVSEPTSIFADTPEQKRLTVHVDMPHQALKWLEQESTG